jgi:hypothetical protein
MASPIITAVQFKWVYSVARFFTGLVKKYNVRASAALQMYVTLNDARGLMVSGIDFAVM